MSPSRRTPSSIWAGVTALNASRNERAPTGREVKSAPGTNGTPASVAAASSEAVSYPSGSSIQ